MPAEGEAAREIQILKVGSFNHPIYGSFEIKPEDLKQFKANFERNVRKIDLAINYDHEKTVAAGWYRGLAIKEGGRELWATPEWTARAREQIEGKEYRYFSAEFAWEYVDSETGKRTERVLLGGALTNYPFIKGMKPVEASETESEKESFKMLTKIELITQLHENFGVDVRSLEAKSQELKDAQTKVSELSEKVTTAETKLSEALTKNAALSAQLETVEKEKAEIKFSELVKKGMAEGKLTKAFAESEFKSVFEKMGLEFAEKMLNGMPKVVNTAFKGHANDVEASDSKDAKDAALALSEKAQALAKKDKISFNEALDQVMAAEPELARTYDGWAKE